MKKFLSFILSILLVIGIAACDNNKDPKDNKETENGTSETGGGTSETGGGTSETTEETKETETVVIRELEYENTIINGILRPFSVSDVLSKLDGKALGYISDKAVQMKGIVTSSTYDVYGSTKSYNLVLTEEKDDTEYSLLVYGASIASNIDDIPCVGDEVKVTGYYANFKSGDYDFTGTLELSATGARYETRTRQFPTIDKITHIEYEDSTTYSIVDIYGHDLSSEANILIDETPIDLTKSYTYKSGEGVLFETQIINEEYEVIQVRVSGKKADGGDGLYSFNAEITNNVQVCLAKKSSNIKIAKAVSTATSSTYRETIDQYNSRIGLDETIFSVTSNKGVSLNSKDKWANLGASGRMGLYFEEIGSVMILYANKSTGTVIYGTNASFVLTGAKALAIEIEYATGTDCYNNNLTVFIGTMPDEKKENTLPTCSTPGLTNYTLGEEEVGVSAFAIQNVNEQLTSNRVYIKTLTIYYSLTE